MNYFAHSLGYLDRPYFLAGLAVPDWLSVSDRKCRPRRRTIEEQLDGLSGADREIALGIRQHLDDDQWFHGTRVFYEVTGEIGREFRVTLGEEESWPFGFLGHLVMELLLDAALIEAAPQTLEDYYDIIGEVDPERVQRVVAELSMHPPERLAEFIELYRKERFLEDYVDDRRLLRRLNQVMSRVGLPGMPVQVLPVLRESRKIVRKSLRELLPPDRRAATDLLVGTIPKR